MTTDNTNNPNPAAAQPAAQPAPAGQSVGSTGPAGAPRGPRPGGYVPRPMGGPGSIPGKMGGGRPPMQGGRGGRPVRRRVCRICLEHRGGVDWKAVNFLRNFITERGKILSARATGTCSRCQRQLTQAIKRARTMALIPTSPL